MTSRRRVPVLSPRERQILRAAAEGETSRETADRLDIGYEAVKAIRKSVLRKLGARTIAHAVAVWKDVGG